MTTDPTLPDQCTDGYEKYGSHSNCKPPNGTATRSCKAMDMSDTHPKYSRNIHTHLPSPEMFPFLRGVSHIVRRSAACSEVHEDLSKNPECQKQPLLLQQLKTWNLPS